MPSYYYRELMNKLRKLKKWSINAEQYRQKNGVTHDEGRY